MNKQFKYLVLLLVVTTFLYLPSLKNKFNNWDDAAYILSNPHIELNKANVEKSFLQGEVHRMYAPLTALSNSIVYHFYGLNPRPYILINLIIHLCNIILIFIFISLIIKNPYVPLITAVLFALHPMQVESVAYAAGRRDVLYVFFYVLCLIFYIRSLERKKLHVIKYVLSLLFALLALLSKGQALTIPFTLVLISMFMDRKWNSKSFWLDKLPYFLITAVIAYKIFSAPQYAAGGFTNSSYMDSSIPVVNRIVYAVYGFVQYIILLLVPYKLSLVHPYPEIDGKYIIPGLYYFYIIIFSGLIYFFFRYARKNKFLWFGLAFFAVNIFMLLQLIPNSYGIMNDHYVYFAGVGIFFIIGKNVSDKLQNKKYVAVLVFVFIIYSIILSVLSFQRINVFKDSVTVWGDVIAKYPECYMAYNNRGLANYDKGLINKAMNDYTKAIELKPDYAAPYNNRGVVYNDQRMFDKAITDYRQAIELAPNYADAYYNRANTLASQGLFFIAITDYTKAIELNPDNAMSYNNRGAIYNDEGLYDKAIDDYTKAIELTPDYALAYNNRGLACYNNGLFDKACQDFNKAGELGSEEAKENAEKYCNNNKK